MTTAIDVGKWLKQHLVGASAVITALFALGGAFVFLDSLVLTEAEADELLAQQIQVLQKLSDRLDNEARDREIEDLVGQLQRIDFQISYLSRLETPTTDNVLQLEVLRENRGQLRSRLRYLRCIDGGMTPEQCR